MENEIILSNKAFKWLCPTPSTDGQRGEKTLEYLVGGYEIKLQCYKCTSCCDRISDIFQ